MLPSAIRVGPYTYRVESVWKEQNWGFIAHTEQLITIDSALTEERRRVALWHEITHACTNLAGLPDQTTEEQFATSVAPLQMMVLRDNPELVAYLTADA